LTFSPSYLFPRLFPISEAYLFPRLFPISKHCRIKKKKKKKEGLRFGAIVRAIAPCNPFLRVEIES
jgi:hypothetical protein